MCACVSVCIHIRICTNTGVELLCIFASLYLSNCDVIGFRPKVCYCNTFTEKKKKKKRKNFAPSAVVVKDFMLVLMLQSNCSVMNKNFKVITLVFCFFPFSLSVIQTMSVYNVISGVGMRAELLSS